MGIFRPSTLAEEEDPRWQLRRRRILMALGFLSLGVAAAVVWFSIGGLTGLPGRPPAAVDAAPAPQPIPGVDPATVAGPSELMLATPGIPLRFPAQVVAEKARASLDLADPWTIEWLRAWDSIEAQGASVEDKVRALQVLLMVGDVVHARFWHRGLLRSMTDPRIDRESMSPELLKQIRVLNLLMSGLVESALAELLQTQGQRELVPEERLMMILVRRELSGGDFTDGWAEQLIALAAEENRGGALARLLLLRYLELGVARGLPMRALRATGNERLVEAVGGGEVTPPLEDVSRELARWLQQFWSDRSEADGEIFKMALLFLEWALATEDEDARAVEARIAEWAAGLGEHERVFVADWLARCGAWEHVVDLLGPQQQTLLDPRTMNLYAVAMTELGRLEELTEEMGRHNSRWPEPVVLLWTAQESLAGRRLSSQPVLQGLLMRAARGAQSLNPPWIFDIARSAFMADLDETGQDLILLATEEPEIRERALSMLLDRMLQETKGADALYVLEQLRLLDSFPGPWHGLYLWLKLMVEKNPSEIVGETRRWLEFVDELRRSEAHFIGAMAASEAGLEDLAKSWLPQVNASELAPRYLLFYYALIDRLQMGDFLLGPSEPRAGEGTAFITLEEAAWLRENCPVEDSPVGL